MGKAVCRGQGLSVEVELKSVNNRYLVMKHRLPEALSPYETRIQNLIRSRIVRGTVELFIKVKSTANSATTRVNRDMLDRYLEAVMRIRRKEKLDKAVTPELLLGLPGVIRIEEELKISNKTFPLIEEAVEAALQRMLKMRGTEGKRMVRIIAKRRRLLEKYLAVIEKNARNSSQERQERLVARINELLDHATLSPDDPTLQREIAVLADRADISEEIDRLKSHMTQFDGIIKAEGEMGRQLDFLIQEMAREVNTIGSKASKTEISHHVVRMKAELEKIREQVQNIE